MEQTVKERLKYFLALKGIKNATFERMAHLANGYVNNMKKSFSIEKSKNIAEALPDLNMDWLLTGEGEPFKKEESSDVSNVQQGDDNFNQQNSTELFSKALDEIAAQRKLTERTQEMFEKMMSELIEIIKKESP